MTQQRDNAGVIKAVPCTVRSGNAVEDETKVVRRRILPFGHFKIVNYFEG